MAAELLREPGRVALAGARRELTVLFVDLGGFTTLAEELPPEAVVAHLNEYFEAVCGSVLDEDGTVKDFQGDGVVAFWGAPIAQPDHAVRAGRAALAAVERLERLRARWIGRGVAGAELPHRPAHRGARRGRDRLGRARHVRVVGDGMNLAARLEGANKLYGTRVILISEATRAALGPAFLTREIDRVRVVGRKQPVRLFELVAHESSAGALARRTCELYARALGAYRARDFALRGRALEELLAIAPDDGPARVLLSRLAELARNPPPPATGTECSRSRPSEARARRHRTASQRAAPARRRTRRSPSRPAVARELRHAHVLDPRQAERAARSMPAPPPRRRRAPRSAPSSGPRSPPP